MTRITFTTLTWHTLCASEEKRATAATQWSRPMNLWALYGTDLRLEENLGRSAEQTTSTSPAQVWLGGGCPMRDIVAISWLMQPRARTLLYMIDWLHIGPHSGKSRRNILGSVCTLRESWDKAEIKLRESLENSMKIWTRKLKIYSSRQTCWTDKAKDLHWTFCLFQDVCDGRWKE